MSELQRSRIISGTLGVMAEFGYDHLTVARVASRAGVSRRTFYELFEDREDCYLAAFDDVVAQLRQTVLPAYERGTVWQERVRGALTELLEFFDEEPGARALLVLDALKAGPRVLGRRAELLAKLSLLLHEGGVDAARASSFPPLTGEGVVGAVLGVIHTRLLAGHSGTLLELLNPLMGMIVLPYLGREAAQRELERTTPERSRASGSPHKARRAATGALAGLTIRITYRTMLVLTVIGEHVGASNRQIADLAGISDQGQMSKLLARLERLGLTDNRGEGQASGEPNAWQLTEKGREVQDAIQAQPNHTNRQVNATKEPI